MIEEERKRRLFLQKYFETAIKREKVQKIRVCRVFEFFSSSYFAI